jgi:PilZ domain-containing protein
MSVSPHVAVLDKRLHPRTIINVAASCQPRDAPPVHGVARDIGLGGIFIEAADSLPFGTELFIVLRLPGAKADLRLPGVVRWVKSDGFGVQFGLLGARDTHAISALLKL